MPISNVGSVVYTNQNTPSVAYVQKGEQAKFLAQSIIAAELLQEKEKIIEEIRPAEEISKIRPEKEEEKREKKKNQKKNEKLKKTQFLLNEEEIEEEHYLDIKV